MVSSPQPSSLSELIARCQSQESSGEGAFRELYEATKNKVFLYTLSRLPTRDHALDATQEVYIALWKSLPRFSYRSDASFFAYLFTIVKRVIAGYYRSEHLRQTVEFTDSHVRDNYQLAYEDYRALYNLIDQLKPKFRELLRLRYWASLPWSEVAASLGITEGTAKVWHTRAMRKLQSLSERKRIA